MLIKIICEISLESCNLLNYLYNLYLPMLLKEAENDQNQIYRESIIEIWQ